MFGNIFHTFANCFKIPELKSRILFTLALLAVARVLAYVPIPGVDAGTLSAWSDQNSHGAAGVLGLYNRFAGGAYLNCAVGALGIMPYVSASIILQMLGAVFPRLSKLAREEGGRAKLIQYGRYLTIPLCIGQGCYFANSYLNPGSLFQGYNGPPLVVMQNHYLYFFLAVTVMTTATLLLMWLGEQITERGIGNGVSLIITIGIVAGLPYAVYDLKNMFWPSTGEAQYHPFGTGLLLLGLLVGVIAGIIAITQAQRKVPVQYASRMVGRKMYQGGTNYLPLQLNAANVMPIIFASSILMFPGPICNWLATHAHPTFLQPPFQWLAVRLNYGSAFYLGIYTVLILFFSYFWVAIQFNEIQIADDLKKNGGYIPGVRPGQSTSDYLHKSMSRLTLAGAIFLTLIAVIPILLYKQIGISQNVAQFFGGTSILIAVGVLLNTMRQVESHLMMRHYDGFLKKGKVRGRF